MKKKRLWMIVAVVAALAVIAAVVILVTSQKKEETPAPTPAATVSPEKTAAPDLITPTSTPEATEVQTAVPTPRRTVRITNPPTEVPTPVPPTPTPNPWNDTEYPPTCVEAGYIVHENTYEGVTTILEGAPALGHDWAEWVEDPDSGKMVSTCTRCGLQLMRSDIYTGTIPRIDFWGSMDGISKADRVTLGFDFTSPTEIFSCYSFTTWQGHNTLNFPKKNFTIRLFNDEEITEKHRLIFNGWQREHKYVLKANYRDFSQSRNLVAANLWADIAATRANLFPTLRRTSNFGAVDGFPVIVYLNGEFIGLYTMNLHIDNDLYQMDNAYDAVMIANSTEPEETRFYALAAFEDEKNAWEVEYCGTGNDNQWAKDSLNELITFVMTSDDETFRAHLGDYLDVDAAIDYLIFLYVTGLESNASQDLVLLKYHDCDVWIPSVYDMEHAFGLSQDGTAYLAADHFVPVQRDGIWDSGTNSLLWDRLLQLFEPEIRARYAELRQNVLTEDELTARVNAFMDQVPDEYYEMDAALWPRQLPEGSQREQMATYTLERLRLMDAVFIGK